VSRAISLNSKFGDAWIYYYAMEYLQLHKKSLLVTPASSEGQQQEAEEVKEEDDEDDELGDAYITSSGPTNNGDSSAVPTVPAVAALGVAPLQGDVLAAIAEQCAAAQPNSGELWCSVSKETKLRRKDVREVLKIAAGRVLDLTIE